MGGLFSGSSKTTTNETTDTGPSKFQLPYLQSAFDTAQGNFNSQKDTPWFQGDLYAGMSDAGKADLSTMKSYATGQGLSTANKLSSIGSSLAGFGDKAASALDSLQELSSGDATAENLKAAGAYADNPYISGQIDAVNRDVSRSLAEQTLPGIDRAASGTGNLNSSRAGVAAGIAQRGAEDRMADTAASIRSQAFNNGLSLAQQDRAQKLNAVNSAVSGYTGLAGMGIDSLNAGTAAGYGAFNVLNSANEAERDDRQGQLDADFQEWEGADTRASDLLQRYYDIIGGNQWGTYGTSKGTSKTKSKPSLMQSLTQAASAAAAFA